jgi:dethiobiotin synthetase
MKTLLITGTDTDVGKTIITLALRAYYQKYFPHWSIGLMKLLQTGERVDSTSADILSDRQFYQQFFPDVVIPLSFSAPLAPPLAAELEGKLIDLKIIWQSLVQLQQEKELVLVEALGGLGSPITAELTIADLAGSWRLETILVVPVKLGAIANAVSNVALARQHQLKIRGIIFNCVHPCSKEEQDHWTPKDLVESLTQVPVLGYFPYLERIDNLADLAVITAENLF